MFVIKFQLKKSNFILINLLNLPIVINEEVLFFSKIGMEKYGMTEEESLSFLSQFDLPKNVKLVNNI